MRYPPQIVGVYIALAAAGGFIVVDHFEVVRSSDRLLWSSTLAFLVLGATAGWHGSAMGSSRQRIIHAPRRGGDLMIAAAAAGTVFYLDDPLPPGGGLWVGGAGMTAMAAGFLVGALFRKAPAASDGQDLKSLHGR